MSPFSHGPEGFALGIIVLGVFLWEVLFNGNAKRWQVWTLLPAIGIWLYGEVINWMGHDAMSRYDDPTWWWLFSCCGVPLTLTPYAWFAMGQWSGRT